MTISQVSDLAVHPGEYIADELEARGLSQRELARQMGRPYQSLNQIIRGHKPVTADTALDLEAAFGVSAQTWLNLQTAFDLTTARQLRATRMA
ncbi:MAG: HigA family addiction module antitoxin [Dehalococcoidia bacterium]